LTLERLLMEEQNKPETARKGKTMKLEDIKNKTKDAVDYLVQSLESGHSEVLTQYLGAMARFHAATPSQVRSRNVPNGLVVGNNLCSRRSKSCVNG
jgi:hypothetical protein